MASIIKASDLDNLIREYMAGASTTELSRKFGVQPQSILARLKKAGVPTRTIAEAKALHLPPIDLPRLVADYQQGASINALSKRLGITRDTITDRLLSAGVKLRDQSAAETLKWSGMGLAARRAQVAAANAASRVLFKGKSPSRAAMIAKSAAWERGRFMTQSERAVSFILNDLGIPHTPQKLVGAYNVDLAIDEMPIAVEVCWSHPGRTYGPKLRRKVVDLLDQGWHIIFIWMLCGNAIDLRRIDKHLPSWLDRARRDKSVFGRYGVIRCDSKTRPILSEYLYGLPLVSSP